MGKNVVEGVREGKGDWKWGPNHPIKSQGKGGNLTKKV